MLGTRYWMARKLKNCKILQLLTSHEQKFELLFSIPNRRNQSVRKKYVRG